MSAATRRAVIGGALTLPAAAGFAVTGSADVADPGFMTWDECEEHVRSRDPRLRLMVALGRASGMTPPDFFGPVIEMVAAARAERRP